MHRKVFPGNKNYQVCDACLGMYIGYPHHYKNKPLQMCDAEFFFLTSNHLKIMGCIFSDCTLRKRIEESQD